MYILLYLYSLSYDQPLIHMTSYTDQPVPFYRILIFSRAYTRSVESGSLLIDLAAKKDRSHGSRAVAETDQSQTAKFASGLLSRDIKLLEVLTEVLIATPLSASILGTGASPIMHISIVLHLILYSIYHVFGPLANIYVLVKVFQTIDIGFRQESKLSSSMRAHSAPNASLSKPSATGTLIPLDRVFEDRSY